jgi:hypothetical protein
MIKPKPAWAVNPRSILFTPWLALSLRCGQQRNEVGQIEALIVLIQVLRFFNVERPLKYKGQMRVRPLAGAVNSDTGGD